MVLIIDHLDDELRSLLQDEDDDEDEDEEDDAR